jgi:hypothetical protein
MTSRINTPGIIGVPGKCPWKKGSLIVTFFSLTNFCSEPAQVSEQSKSRGIEGEALSSCHQSHNFLSFFLSNKPGGWNCFQGLGYSLKLLINTRIRVNRNNRVNKPQSYSE